MSTMSLRLPESLHKKVPEVAEQERKVKDRPPVPGDEL